MYLLIDQTFYLTIPTLPLKTCLTKLDNLLLEVPQLKHFEIS